MTKKQTSLNRWRNLSLNEKLNMIHEWYPLNIKEKGELPNAILKEFLRNVKDKKHIKKVEFGRDGLGDALFLFVTVKKGKKVRLPRVYDEVFPVRKIYG